MPSLQNVSVLGYQIPIYSQPNVGTRYIASGDLNNFKMGSKKCAQIY